jgi:UDP-N-acetyl-D-glucosamine dehydrogenase
MANDIRQADPPVAREGSSDDKHVAGRRPVVCVQGLGFVGAAVCVAIASARDPHGRAVYDVLGVDLPTPDGMQRIEALNKGTFPFATTDVQLQAKLQQALATGNLAASSDPRIFGTATIILVDVPLGIRENALELEPFQAAIETLGAYIRPDALVIVETTVPPGATSDIVVPVLRRQLAARGLPTDQVRIAHCYERVTPGASYLQSIIDMPRVYAGINEQSADACEAFLRTIVDDTKAPPTRLGNTTASELSKLLENSFRAVTIALMEEFATFAENVGVDLFEIADAIRIRPTHRNIRSPGFGVGGYCLTKDPLIAGLAAREIFGLEQAFPFSSLAVSTNRVAPHRVLERLSGLMGGELRGRRILLLGLSYREDIGDTRHSPSEVFYRAAKAKGAEVLVHDPLVQHWREQEMDPPEDVPAAAGLDAVVLALPHGFYRAFDYPGWLGPHRPLFLDAFNVLTSDRRRELRGLGCRVESIGRGAGL